MKKIIERQLEHHELMDWVESAATPEEMQERADHANAGYPVFVKEEIDDVAANHEPGQPLPEDQAERAANGSGWQGEEITDAEWEEMQKASAKPYDYKRSFFMAKQVWTVPKQCWSNAVRALRTRRKLVRNAWYVEGFIEFIPGLYLEHGWLELPDGTIIDTTRAYLEHYHNQEPDNRTYHPVLKYTLADLKGVRGEQLPLGMIELNIWQFEQFIRTAQAEVQHSMLRGQSPEAYFENMREGTCLPQAIQYVKKQVQL